MIEYSKLKEKPREFLAVTSLTDEEFQALLPTFERCYEVLSPPKPKASKKKKQRAKGGGRRGNLSSINEKLLFILVYQKTAPLQVAHGLQFGLSQGRVNYWAHRLLPVLQMSLSKMGMKPVRKGEEVAVSIEASEGGANLSLDAAERLLQRPVNDEKQREKYSGKRKTHTDKNLLLVNENTKKVVYLSETAKGKMHDKKLADKSKISYPRNASLTQDTGFQGYQPSEVVVQQPKKSKKRRTDRD
ncbi:MAG: transposase [Acidobacteria bacterium]|nr:transposase [Acidobacteriota bacterium]